MERTLAIIKPEILKNGLMGKIISRIEEEGIKISAMKMVHLTRDQAGKFYYVHKGKFFYDELTEYMSSGPIVVMVLSGEGVIDRWRRIMGATDPAKAEEGTLRKLYGTNIQNNAVHGSDSPESASFEIGFFFSTMEIENGI